MTAVTTSAGRAVLTAPANGRANPPAASQEAHGPALDLAEEGAPAPVSRPRRRGRAARRTLSAGEQQDSGALGTPRRAPEVSAVLAHLAQIRHALRDHPMDEALQLCAGTLANVFAPSQVELWLADPAPWIGALSRTGGLELDLALRMGACAMARSSSPEWERAPADRAAIQACAESRAPHPIIRDALALRRPVVHIEPGGVSLTERWGAAAPPPLAVIRTLAAYPLEVRGELLGALVLASEHPLNGEELAILEAVADHCALAAEHASLVSFSRGHEALAQTVVRHAPVAVAVFSGPDHIVALANPAFAQLLDTDLSLRGCRLEDVAPGAARLRDGLRLDSVYQTGEPEAMVEMPVHLARGLTYWNVTSSPLPGSTDRVGGVLVAAIDVTHQVLERQRALETAKVAQERVSQMMALHATSLAVSSQLGTDPRELLVDILNRSIRLLNGRAGTVYVLDGRTETLEAFVSLGLRGQYTGSRIRVGQGLVGQVARTGQGLLEDDMRTRPASGAIYRGEAISAAIAAPLISRNQVVGVLEVLDDADKRTFTRDDLWLLELFASQAAQAVENARTYAELEVAYEAQRNLDRLKDDFIATASHELRTPLTGVQGFLALLLDYSGSRDEPLALEFLHKAADSAAELVELTERLLETSHLDTGRVEVHCEPVPLRSIVDDVLRNQAAALASASTASASHAHRLMAHVPEPVHVWADPDRLREVLSNLVSNAIKYSPRGGTVRVACTLEASEASATSPDYAVITVTDEGIGIAPAERDRLFERFSRLDAARANHIRGTGLGLYICRQLIRAMGGSIWLQESIPGRGSTFAVALPLSRPLPATSASGLLPS